MSDIRGHSPVWLFLNLHHAISPFCTGAAGARDTLIVSINLTVCTLVHTIDGVDIECDHQKAAANLEKHKVDFADAATALADELAITIRDERLEEERFVTVGMDVLGRVLVIVYTWRQDRIRIISARKATRGERRRYEG